MRSVLVRCCDQAGATLRELMDRPWSLFFVLLAVNAVALPYRGITHDAQLYSAQVLNRVQDGPYADDFFFRYFSQDKYSAFSLTAAPVVSLLGLQGGFFLLYLVFSSLLLLAVQRLLLALLKDRWVVALCLLILATTELPYGGLGLLNVNERFVTPRLFATALVVFALEQTVRARYKTALALLAGAGLMHPLMAVGGALVFAGWWLVDRLGWRRTALVCAPLAVAAAAVLLYRPLGLRVFGRMDDEWREYARRACPMNAASEWPLGDWLRLAACATFVLGLAVCSGRDERDRRLSRFALLVGAASALAVLGTLLANVLPYALLYQGQAYRALWLLSLMQAPFGLQLAADLWRQGRRGQFLALAIAAYFGMTFYSPGEFAIAGFAALCTAAVYYRAFSPAPRHADWLVRSLLAGILLGGLAVALLRFVRVADATNWILGIANIVDYASVLASCPGHIGWAALCLAALLAGRRLLGLGGRFRLAAAGAWLAAQTAAFVLIAAHVADAPTRPASDMQFVNRFLRAHGESGDRLPTIYCSTDEIGNIWFIARAKSYFNRYQLVGNLFNREEAVEGRRRALLVRSFEQERYRRYLWFLPDEFRKNQEELYEAPIEIDPPTLDDLAAVCREDGVDFVVVPDAFDAPCAATNGRIYIYDCRQVRAALGGRSTAVAAHAATERTPDDSLASVKIP